MLRNGELPGVDEFVFNAVFDVREVADTTCLNPADSTDQVKAFIEASQLVGGVRVSRTGNVPRFDIFHEVGASEIVISELQRSLAPSVAALTYAAFGLDVSGFLQASRDES